MMSWEEWLSLYAEDEPAADDTAAKELAMWELEQLQQLELLVGTIA